MRGLKGRLRRAKVKRAARRKKRAQKKTRPSLARSVIAAATNAGALLTFRAELMPGRDSIERTFTVARVLASGRVELNGLTGQHAMTEFEQVQ
jgi:hypothetical protein